MILVNLLATTCLITLARGSPMSYATYRRREFPIDERPELLLLYDQRGLQNTDSSSRSAYEMAERDYGNEISLNDGISGIPNESTISRDKKITLSQKSLSIVNPIEVLRERVLLELARHRAAQNQLQVDANRRMLDSVGKRSLHEFESGFPRNVVQSSSSANERASYGNNQQSAPRHDDHQSASYTQRIPIERTHEWYKVDDSVMRGGNSDDEARKILATYHHDRM